MPLTPPPLELLERRVVGQQLRVDVQLTDATRDELRELAAEVEHDDAVGRLRRAADGGPLVGIPGRGRGVERDLEVGLDLGVVGRQHAMAGVGLLAVDGLAALRCCRLAPSIRSPPLRSLGDRRGRPGVRSLRPSLPKPGGRAPG